MTGQWRSGSKGKRCFGTDGQSCTWNVWPVGLNAEKTAPQQAGSTVDDGFEVGFVAENQS
jgi:hypothetical protein